MKLVVCFIIFGFLFGLFTKVDSTGGEIPYSMMLNIPTLYVQGIVGNMFNKLEEARVKQLRKNLGITNQELSVPSDEFEGLSYNEKKERFASKMISEKNLQRNDPLIGEKGTLRMIRDLISFPILSAFTWGLIGFLIYILIVLKKKVSASQTDQDE